MLKLFIKGLIIGIGKILPGVSGAMLAISLDVYKESISSICNFFKSPIKSLKLLFPLGGGIIISIIFMSKIIKFFLNRFFLSTMLLFVGLIIGGFINFIKKIDKKKANWFHYIIMLLSFTLIIFFEYMNNSFAFHYENNFFTYFFIGFLDAITMIIPGLCGTAIMMLFGCYDLLLNLLANLSSIHGIIANFNLLIFYSIGMIFTILVCSKVLNYLYTKKELFLYFSIIGFTLASIVILLISTLNYNYQILEIIISLILLIVGYIIGHNLES